MKLNESKVNFFRPFNSAFERTAHTQTKQKKNFNHNGLLNNTDLNRGSQAYLHDFSRVVSQENLVKVQEYENGSVIAGKRALRKVC